MVGLYICAVWAYICRSILYKKSESHCWDTCVCKYSLSKINEVDAVTCKASWNCRHTQFYKYLTIKIAKSRIISNNKDSISQWLLFILLFTKFTLVTDFITYFESIGYKSSNTKTPITYLLRKNICFI